MQTITLIKISWKRSDGYVPSMEKPVADALAATAFLEGFVEGRKSSENYSSFTVSIEVNKELPKA